MGNKLEIKSVRAERLAFLTVLFLMLVLMPTKVFANSSEYKKISTKIKVPFNKIWTIKMTEPLDASSVNNKNIKVVDAFGKNANAKVKLGKKNNVITVEPPINGYQFGKTYNLLISQNIKSQDGTKMNDNTKMVFTIEELPSIEMLKIDHDPFIVGDKLNAYVNTKENREVQYNVYLYDKSKKKNIKITDGYSKAIDGKKPFYITYEKKILPGEYSLKVYTKRAGAKGKKKNSLTDYDDMDSVSFTCLEKNDKKLVSVNDKVILRGKNYTTINGGYSYKIGEKITIKGINNISGKDGNYKYKLHAYNLTNPIDIKDITSYKDTLEWLPPEAGSYILEIWVKAYDKRRQSSISKNSKPDAKKFLYVEVYNKQINYVDYDITLDDFVDIETDEERRTIYWVDGEWKSPSKELVEYYANPESFSSSEYGIYQFLTLNYIEGITEEDLNMFLKGKGILEGKGAAILEGAKKYDVNPVYLVAHTMLETGNGKSVLAKGVKVSSVEGKAVKPKKAYNMYGIHAFDTNPNKFGSEFAYSQKWFTPEKALIEGAAWIGKNYINSEKYNQNTLYKMKWNVDVPWHQYATDIRWAYNQIAGIKDYLDKCKKAFLIFEVPRFKEPVSNK